jgi:hypothetical protein
MRLRSSKARLCRRCALSERARGYPALVGVLNV